MRIADGQTVLGPERAVLAIAGHAARALGRRLLSASAPIAVTAFPVRRDGPPPSRAKLGLRRVVLVRLAQTRALLAAFAILRRLLLRRAAEFAKPIRSGLPSVPAAAVLAVPALARPRGKQDHVAYVPRFSVAIEA